MKVGRFSHEGALAYGVLDEEAQEWVLLKGDPMFAGYDTTGERAKITEVTLVAPVIPRSKVVGVGKNYHDHVAEMKSVTGGDAPKEPLLFLKPNTAVIGPNEPIVLPAISQRVEHEGELVAVIGKVAKNVPVEKALDYVFGYTIGNDVSARDLQVGDGQWARAKGFDTFAPLGPVIETEFDPTDAALQVRVNGEIRQDGNTGDLIFGIPQIIAHASAAFTLLPGDVIMTGTPAGVGPLVAGDTVEVEIEGLGILRNPVKAS
ncbi:fumarylacetoacetate hydrolase family protein [Gryllotalpicola ginsengisoli]|uniref:fumarylacetoacetate hydrolase family protein n=1 Tax=Gryllotalpicola ginsengisoli TaxID=444608 RepID=UPI0003B5DAF4|nr:fumarylacetoacetate hydrolase family protein [Gryllotalpicola ginsengisoli]